MSKAAELAALIGSQSALSNRNMIINGAMQVAQRGTSFTNPSSGAYTLDRWTTYHSHDGAVDISQSTTAPAGFKNSMKLAVTTADASLSSSQYYILAQVVEGQNISHLNYGSADAKQVTISFWVRSNKTGTYYVEIQTSGSYELSRPYTIDTANTWEYKTLTWIANTDFTTDETNDAGLYLYWWLAAGSDSTGSPLATTWANNSNRVTNIENFLDSTSNEFYITGIQLELGETATPFEHRSYGDELARCQRYYYQTLTGAAYQRHGLGTAINTSLVDMPYRLPQTMRTRPSTTKSGSMFIEGNTSKSVSAVALSTNGSSADVVRYSITCATPLTVGYAYYFMNGNDANAYITFDAEL